MRRTRVLYIAGSNRSGSTLLARLLGGLPGFFPIGEGLLHFFGGNVNSHVPCGCGMLVKECPFWRDVLRPPEGVPFALPWLRLHRIPFFDSHLRRHPKQANELMELAGNFYDTIAKRSGADVIVDSSKNGLYGRFLLRVPNIDLDVLYLVRDPRGVIASHRRPKGWIPSASPLRATKRWLLATIGCEYFLTKAPRWRTLRYEDLVKDPKGSTLQIAADFGYKFGSPDSLSVASGSVQFGTQHILGSNPDKLEHGPIKISNRSGELTRGSRALVSGITAPFLWRYGYWGQNPERHLQIAPERSAEAVEEPELVQE